MKTTLRKTLETEILNWLIVVTDKLNKKNEDSPLVDIQKGTISSFTLQRTNNDGTKEELSIDVYPNLKHGVKKAEYSKTIQHMENNLNIMHRITISGDWEKGLFEHRTERNDFFSLFQWNLVDSYTDEKETIIPPFVLPTIAQLQLAADIKRAQERTASETTNKTSTTDNNAVNSTPLPPKGCAPILGMLGITAALIAASGLLGCTHNNKQQIPTQMKTSTSYTEQAQIILHKKVTTKPDISHIHV